MLSLTRTSSCRYSPSFAKSTSLVPGPRSPPLPFPSTQTSWTTVSLISSRPYAPILIVYSGAVVVPGPATTGASIHVWGTGNALPLNASQDWSPAHTVLDGYNSSPYSDCRSTSVRRFFAREWGIFSMVIWRVYVFSTYRVRRWFYVHSLRLYFAIIFVFVSIVVVNFFD